MLNKRTFVGCSNLSSLKVLVRFLIWIYFLSFYIVRSLSLTDSPSQLMQCIREKRHNRSSFERVARHEPKCETFGCVKLAAQIVSYLNETIDPCDDFYHFANGHFIDDKSDDTEDNESTNFVTEITDSVNRKVWQILKEPLQPNEWKPFELVKNFYKSCINQQTEVKRGNQQLIDILDSLGSWPVLKGKSWQARAFDFIELIKKVKEVGFDANIIFDVNVGIDPNNSTNRVLKISSGEYVAQDESLVKYRKTMFEISAIFLGKIDAATKARIEKEMGKVLAFECKLISIAYGYGGQKTDSENSRNHTDRKTYSDDYTYDDADSENDTFDDVEINLDFDFYLMYGDKLSTIKEIQESYPYLNWLEYINAILPSGFNVTENEPILNFKPLFFEQLGDLMNSTSPRTIANYIIWRAIYKSYQMQTHWNQFLGKVRRDKCMQSTFEKFTIPVGLLYCRKYFGKKTRKAVIDLVEDIRDAFIDLLGEVTWMDDDTREKAIAKAKNIKSYIGYPNEWYDEDAEIIEYYEDLKMEPDNFVNNSLRWNLFNNDQKFRTLRKPMNRSEWDDLLEFNQFEVNAFYNPTVNSINFPIAIVHEILFSVDRPQYINYAKLGYIIGHEITHGFDNDGCEYDLNGDFNNWWTPESKENFTEKAKCFINQYNHYTDRKTNLTINGKRTLGENIADNGGTRAAYYAYQNWIKRNEPERLVPGVKYNQNQLFWISLAQSYSSVDGEMMMRDLILQDYHSPNEFRINGVVSNLDEFARDFNCAVGTKMNSEAGKCKVW